MILNKVPFEKFPFSWADLEFYPNSNAIRKEIYIINFEYEISELALLFYTLFGTRKEEIVIYQKSWWDFSLESWNIQTGESDYSLNNTSPETKDYLEMLIDNDIEIGFKGFCTCTDWDSHLSKVLPCILYHQAPYSPLYLDLQNEYFFYFHHTGSIGIYYKRGNAYIESLFKKAEGLYEIVSY